MFRIRGRAANGDSVTGVSTAESFSDAATEAETIAESGGSELKYLSIKPLDEGGGLKMAKPRKRDGGKSGGKKK